MKIFKNVLKITMVITFLFLFSCKKEPNEKQNEYNVNTLTDEIDKVETRYQEGDIKIETIADPDFQRSHTSAPESYKEKVRQELGESYSKQTNYLKSGANTVGVIKDGTCGAYQELYVHMDCEDSPSRSGYSGNTGACTVNSSGNAIFRFCVVPGTYFKRTDNDYAVLNLTGSYEISEVGVGRIWRYFDNEDSHNMNAFSINGIGFSNSLKGDCYFANNISLGFYYYTASSSEMPYYPPLGFSYKVFGRFGNSQGFIITDDEDNRNANSCSTQMFQGLRVDNVSSVPNILIADGNTRLYMSSVD